MVGSCFDEISNDKAIEPGAVLGYFSILDLGLALSEKTEKTWQRINSAQTSCSVGSKEFHNPEALTSD